MRRLTRNIHWDGENKTLYVQRRASAPDFPKFIEQHRQALELNPEDVGTRYMLASCLYGVGQVAEARVEWERVREAGGAEWAQMVTDTLANLPQASS